MIRILILFALILYSLCLKAQNSAENYTNVAFRAHTGITLSKYRAGSEYNSTPIAGPILGASASKRVFNKLSISALTQYSLRGYNHSEPTYSIKYNCFDWQVLANYYIFPNLAIGIGFQKQNIQDANYSTLNYEVGYDELLFRTELLNQKGKPEFILGGELNIYDKIDLRIKYSFSALKNDYQEMYIRRKVTEIENDKIVRWEKQYFQKYMNLEISLAYRINDYKVKFKQSEGNTLNSQEPLSYNKLKLAGMGLKEIPQSIGGFRNVYELDLSNNELSNLPKEFSNLVNLSEVNFSGNKFDKVDPIILKIAGLEKINLSDNNINEIPEQINQLTKLNMLDISNNPIDKLPSLAGLTSLEQINISKTQIKSIPAQILSIESLRQIIVDESIFIDIEIPDHIKIKVIK